MGNAQPTRSSCSGFQQTSGLFEIYFCAGGEV